MWQRSARNMLARLPDGDTGITSEIGALASAGTAEHPCALHRIPCGVQQTAGHGTVYRPVNRGDDEAQSQVGGVHGRLERAIVLSGVSTAPH